MASEEKSGGFVGEGSQKDRFPVGMSVLAVDDDPTCLKILENLLRKCHYNVTTTNQAITALKLLRENKDNYDIIISDVNMPDIDGFELLELVGLEMDLPVIMISGFSDTELVRKGIMHGACDYLVKPVRIEEIKNIWQHVLRRQKLNSNDQSKSLSEEKNDDGSVGNGQEAASTGNTDQNGKRRRKQKVNQDVDSKTESEESGDDNEGPGTQKKPRLQWTSELQAKFVAAVNQLGYDKAVPKKILDLMNVESLTRENVASHLQKFRHYLKKLSNDAQRPNTSYTSKGSSYLSKGSLDGFGDCSSLPAKGSFSDIVLSPYPGSSLGRLNSSANLSSRGMTSSGLVQPIQRLSNFNAPGKLHPLVLPANQSSNLFQVIPALSEHSGSQCKSANHIGDFHLNNGLTAFTVSSGFPNLGATVAGPCNTLAINSNNPLMLQANASQSESRGAFGTQFPVSMGSLNAESFDVGVRGSNFMNHNGRFNKILQGGVVHTPRFSSCQDPLLNNNLTDSLSSTSAVLANNSFRFPSSSALTAESLGSSTGDLQCPSGSNFNTINNNHNPSHRFDAINTLSSANIGLGSLGQGTEQSHIEAEKYGLDKMEQTQPQDGSLKSNHYSLDDVINSMLNQDPNDMMSMMDGDFSLDPSSLGSFL